MLKKIFALVASFMLIMSLVACSSTQLSGKYIVDDSTLEGKILSSVMNTMEFDGDNVEIKLDDVTLFTGTYTIEDNELIIQSDDIEEGMKGTLSEDLTVIESDGFKFIKEVE